MKKFVKWSEVGNQNLYFVLKVQESEVKDDKIYDLVDKIFDSKCFGMDIEQVIRYIRIIFRDYTEKELKIQLVSGYDFKSVVIVDNEIMEYKMSKQLDVESENVSAKFEYDKVNGVNFSLTNNDYLINVLSEKDNIIGKTAREISNLTDMLNNFNMNFDIDEKLLIDIYKLFFGVYPDFTNKEDVDKTQSMMWLLNRQGICFDEAYFTTTSVGKPWSWAIETIVDRLMPFGKINGYDGNKIKIREQAYKTIESMGKIIGKYSENFEDKNSLLEKISIGSYIMARNTPNEICSTIVSKLVECSIEEATDIYEFLLRMNMAMEDDNPVEKYEELSRENQLVKTKEN